MKILLLLLLTLSGLSLSSCRQDNKINYFGSTFSPVTIAPEIQLSDYHGQPFSLAEKRGKVILLFFGFTHCADICPMALSQWLKIKKALGSKASEIEFIFITVDPGRDHSDSLKDYLEAYDDNFIGLQGTPEKLEMIYKDYGIFRKFEEPKEGSYQINHTNSTIVIDRDGNWRMNFPDTLTLDEIVHDLQLLLTE